MYSIYKGAFVALLAISLSIGFNGCSKSFLEVLPKGKLIAKDFKDYDLLFNNSSLIYFSNNNHVALGDDVAAVDPYFAGTSLTTQRLFRWEDVIYEPEQEALEMLGLTKNIYIYNKIIKEIDDVTDATELQKNRLKAEAKTGRAWANLMLVNYYGKPYNPATASTDLGYPIITVADVTETKFDRGTVQQMYDFILQDLKDAIPYLSENVSHRSRASRPAAEGVLAKTLMYMGRFDEALPAIERVMSSLSTAAVPVRLYNYSTAFSAGGPFFPTTIVGVPMPRVHLYEENIWGKYVTNLWAATSNELVLSPKARALYGATDYRLKFFAPRALLGAPYPAGLVKKQGMFETQLGLTLPEVYLFRAECKARAGDLTAAVADLETLRKNRMPVADAVIPTATATDKLALLHFIMDERVREFPITGYRYYDMRRLSVDPLFGPEEYTHTLFSATGAQTHFKMKQERLTFQFPQKIIDENPGMINNP